MHNKSAIDRKKIDNHIIALANSINDIEYR